MEHINPKNKDELELAVERAKDVLKRGGVVIYPTDTIYGIGVDATNSEAIERVYTLKGRDKVEPLPVIFPDLKSAEEYAELNELSLKIAKRMLPGPITLLLKKKDKLPSELTLGSELLGIRIPDSYFCIALAKSFSLPFTTTSANKSGMRAGNVDEILEQFKNNLELIDLVIDVGALDEKPPSTILDVSENSVQVVREGEQNLQALQLVTLEGED